MSFGAPNVEKPSPAYHGNYGGPGPSAYNMPTPQPYIANQQNQAGPKPGTHQQAPPPQYYQPQHQPTPYQGQPQTQPQMIYVQPQQPQQNKKKDDSCCGPCAFLVGCCAGMLCCPCLLCC
ncbi:hypothetical protein K443DRAFT_105611 [Laccaria amethystina LaAM-08-1]|uniref:Uncharacterized protein n=1 Tax=Laccaria amethystina LaAM-08-1 TaxID=1095629 RepID=A0A0C9X7Z3_9AGAR|nr:hypothetical protein K443DRAFT_105611 [Laccaria amethystina LaAM-08-1]